MSGRIVLEKTFDLPQQGCSYGKDTHREGQAFGYFRKFFGVGESQGIKESAGAGED